MNPLAWSITEKRIARKAFDTALEAQFTELLAEFKSRAVGAQAPAEVWDIEERLALRRREIDALYDYRYSQLIWVFGNLCRKGHVHADQLAGLSEDKLASIERIAKS